LIDNDIPLATFKHPPSDLKKLSENVVSLLANKYDISNINRIKPGIAEATRAVLRRVPEHILVKEIADPDVALLVYLAKQKNIT
ncbi:RNA-binding protein, partial [Klebsiella pneumoniae]